MLTEILIFLVVTLLIRYLTTNVKNSHLPGPTPFPIIGSLHLLDPQYPFKSLFKLREKYGKIFRMKFGSVDMVIVTDHKFLKKILMRDEVIDRPNMYLIELFLRNKGLIWASGHLWKDQRKFVEKYLRGKGASRNSVNRKNLSESTVKNAEGFVDLVKAQGERVSLFPTDLIMYQILCSLRQLYTQDTSNDQHFWEVYLKHLDKIIQLSNIGGALNFIPMSKLFYQKVIGMSNHIYKCIYESQEKLIKQNLENFTGNEENIIHLYHKEQSKTNNSLYTDDQLVHLMNDLYAASLETTTTTMRWILLHLIKYPEIQEKMRNEIFQVLQDKPLEIEDQDSLPYTHAVLTESARIKTIVVFGVPNITSQDIVIDGVKIEKDTTVISNLYGIHMDPEIWENPEEFKPERFLDSEGKFCKHEAFVPFQAGKRICVGKDLAQMVMFIFVVTILRNFRLEEDQPLDFNGLMGGTYQPKQQKIVFNSLKQ